MTAYWSLLKEARHATGYTAKEVATDLGVNKRSIYRWERDPTRSSTAPPPTNSASRPSREMCDLLADYYGLDPVELQRACGHLSAPIVARLTTKPHLFTPSTLERAS